MAVRRCTINIIVCLVSLFSVQAFSQQMNIGSSLPEVNASNDILKPGLNYTIGSSYMFVPHMGSISAVTVSTSLSVPLSAKLSVDGGIIAGYYYSAPLKSNNKDLAYGSFTGLAVYGSASYHINPQLTLYGSAIKQLAGASPFNLLPKTSYAIGSSYDFGNFRIGVTIQASKWDNMYNGPSPINGSQGFYSPFEREQKE